MINLLAVSYNNIGPFKDKLLTIFFDQGKYLVKAPIGAGKSFLFFDGPIYGLYKYSGRNMLNTQSKSGYIKLLFEVEGQTYLIIRNLTKGKSKESCATLLYTVESEKYKGEAAGIITGDIEQTLKTQGVQMEEVTFKNETDLQQTLQNILPPREVFLNTVFLMQDSDNIFELQPADRLTVLKNVFNLIGIDEAKDKIAERKKEIWYKLKATADTSKYDEKLKRLLADYVGTYKKIDGERTTLNAKTFFDELENIYEKVNISEFSTDDFPVKMHEEIDAEVEKKKSDYQKINHQLQTLIESHKVESRKVEEHKKDVKTLTSKIQNLESKISEIDSNKIIKLKDEKKSLQNQHTALQKDVKSEKIKKFHDSHKKIFDDFKANAEPVSHTYLFVQYLKNKGKVLNEELKNAQLHIKHHADTLKEYEAQFENVNSKIMLLDKDISQQKTFDCSKIGANCPFITTINKKTFAQFEKQRDLLQKEKFSREVKLKTLGKEKDFSDQQQKLVSLIEDIKAFLNVIDRRQIENIYDDVQDLQAREKSIDMQIINLEGETKKLEEYKLQIEKNKVHIESIEKQIKETEKKIKEMAREQLSVANAMGKIDYQAILELEKLNTKMKEAYRDINSLVHEFKDVQIQVKQLQQEEEVMNNLYTIFSKELLLLVLQDHLPVLSDIINSYLAQVVEYQISFSLNRTTTDKLELLAQIFDQQGERDVKSLSGGQRVILKIVRMLAISSYIHSPVLFIDETINNLDADTVGRVSDMLEDFVKSRSMKLYAVTHNQQIQAMKFWDKVIELL